MSLFSGYVTVMGNTQSLNIQAVLFIIAFMVMIVFGLFGTVTPFTLQSRRVRQDTLFDCSINSGTGIDMLLISLPTKFLGQSSFRALGVTPYRFLGGLTHAGCIFSAFFSIFLCLLSRPGLFFVLWLLLQSSGVSSVFRGFAAFPVLGISSFSNLWVLAALSLALSRFNPSTFFTVRVMPVWAFLVYPEASKGFEFFARWTTLHNKNTSCVDCLFIVTQTGQRQEVPRDNDSTSGFLRQLSCLCDKVNYTRFGVVLQ